MNNSKVFLIRLVLLLMQEWREDKSVHCENIVFKNTFPCINKASEIKSLKAYNMKRSTLEFYCIFDLLLLGVCHGNDSLKSILTAKWISNTNWFKIQSTKPTACLRVGIHKKSTALYQHYCYSMACELCAVNIETIGTVIHIKSFYDVPTWYTRLSFQRDTNFFVVSLSKALLLVFFSSENYFCDFQKKGPRPKWTIYKHESHKN